MKDAPYSTGHLTGFPEYGLTCCLLVDLRDVAVVDVARVDDHVRSDVPVTGDVRAAKNLCVSTDICTLTDVHVIVKDDIVMNGRMNMEYRESPSRDVAANHHAIKDAGVVANYTLFSNLHVVGNEDIVTDLGVDWYLHLRLVGIDVFLGVSA
jgi:hypothetical protein